MEKLNKTDIFMRTRGDGMENVTPIEIKTKTKSRLVDKLIYRPSDHSSSYLRPVVPVGRIINLVPKYVPKEKKKVSFIKKPKEPKFVPYEPYKAAIEPIISRKKQTKKDRSKNNVDIQDLVTQMSVIAAVEMKKAKKNALESDELLITRTQWENEKLKFETDIKNLRETNMHLENQLKFQAQVNSELKTLLVAAVGEDLETRVQHLTEDKLALARELLKSANHLTSHQEHTEWLSGQCEVWRSKFLASSLMVEELARWKSALTSRITEVRDIVKKLLDERSRVRELSLKSYHSLSLVTEHSVKNFIEPVHVKTTNIVDLSIANQKLSEFLEKNVLKDLPDPRKHRVVEGFAHTPAEIGAIQILKNPVIISDRPDICNAVMGAAVAVGGGQMFLQHPEIHATCCAHCRGEVKDI